jgi:hypothetical protein
MFPSDVVLISFDMSSNPSHRFGSEIYMMERSDRYIKDGKFTAAFDSLVTESMARWKVPGLSIAVVYDEDVYAKACQRFSCLN